MHGDDFLMAAERCFAALRTEFHLELVGRSNSAPEAWLQMQNATTDVTVHLEIGGAPWLVLSAVEQWRGKAVATEGYDLGFLLEERAPQALAALRNAQHIEEVLEMQARYVRMYAEDVLQGDFSVFPQLRTRAKETLRRAEAQLQGRRSEVPNAHGESDFSELTRRLCEFEDVQLAGGATDVEVSGAEEKLGPRVEGTYRDFLRRFGWGSFADIEIFGLGDDVPSHLDLLQVTESERHELESRLQPHLVPLSNDGAGNLYCLDTRVSDEPPVVFWDHEAPSSQTPAVVAAGFATWLIESLVERG